jgi:hypothetical protein
MKKTILIIALLLSSLFATQASAKDYYVCSNGGSNENNGESASLPWETFDFAIGKFNKFQAGDALLLCTGGNFTSSYNRITNYNCTGYNPCTIGSYRTSNSTPLPIIHGTASGALNFQDGGNADHDEGYIVKDLVLKGVGTGNGIFLFNDVDYVTVDNLTIDNFNIGLHSAGANAPNPGANQKNDHLTLRNSKILNNPGQGYLGGCNDCVFEGNQFVNNGFGRKIFNHNFYASGGDRVRIIDNDFYKSTFIEDKCQGVSLVVHGVVKDLVIRGNTIREDLGAAAQTCWGVSVDPGYASEESFTNVVIEENTVTNVGNVGIGCASCVDASILNNKIVHEQAFGIKAINVPVRTEDTVKSDRVQVSGNVIELSGYPNKSGVVISDKPGFNAGSNTVIQY